MRAITHVSVSGPDYALRVPSQLQLLLAAGMFGGLAGIALLIAAPEVLGAVDYVLIGVGVISVAAALALRVITSPGRRERARQQMLDAIAWTGDERVLDVGCGNGFLLVEAAKRLSTGTAIGIDLWKAEAGEQSADVARQNAQLEGVAHRVEIKSGDARNMPFASYSFDVIVSSLMLHHAGGGSDRHRVLSEMLRVLKPGGTIVLYDVLPTHCRRRPLSPPQWRRERHTHRWADADSDRDWRINTMRSAKATVEQYLSAFYAGDSATARPYLADDVSFSGPSASFASAEAFLRASAHVGSSVRAIKIQKLFVDGSDVAVFLELVLDEPHGAISVADWYQLDGDRIASIRTILDTAPFVTASRAPAAETAVDPVCQMTVEKASAAAINDLLLVAAIVATGYRSGFLQARQPFGQNVRGYPLLRPGQQLAEVTAVAEHQVADDDQAPAIPQRLERVRLIGQPEREAFMRTPKTNCDIKLVGLAYDRFP